MPLTPVAPKAPVAPKVSAPAPAATTPATTSAPAAPVVTPKEASPKVESATKAGTQAQVAAVKEMTPEQAKAVMHEIKVNGETKSVPYEVMVALAQKGYAADERFSGAATLAQRMKAAAENFRNDPDPLFREVGMDPDEWAASRTEKWLAQQLEEAALTPEQKKIRDLEKQLAEKEAKKAADVKKEEADKKAADVKAQVPTMGKLIYDAVEASSLPHTDETAEMIRLIVKSGLENGIEYTPVQAAYLAEQSDQQRVQRQIKALAKDKQKLLKFLGPEIIKVINEADIEAIKSRPGAAPEKAVIAQQPNRKDVAEQSRKRKSNSDSAIVKRIVAEMSGPRGSKPV